VPTVTAFKPWLQSGAAGLKRDDGAERHGAWGKVVTLVNYQYNDQARQRSIPTGIGVYDNL
jgi:hypothetical protein